MEEGRPWPWQRTEVGKLLEQHARVGLRVALHARVVGHVVDTLGDGLLHLRMQGGRGGDAPLGRVLVVQADVRDGVQQVLEHLHDLAGRVRGQHVEHVAHRHAVGVLVLFDHVLADDDGEHGLVLPHVLKHPPLASLKETRGVSGGAGRRWRSARAGRRGRVVVVSCMAPAAAALSR